MKPQLLEVLKRLVTDSMFFIETQLMIRTKAAKIINFSTNTGQKKLNAVVERIRRSGRPVRVIVLKARQIGFSTYIGGEIYHKTTTRENMRAAVIAHDKDSTANLFEMHKLFFDTQRELAFRPMRKNLNEKVLSFENPTTNPALKRANPGLRSRIEVHTAGDKNAGRSNTYQIIHASEVAFWEDAKTTMTSLLQTVPDLPETEVYLESTANGIGGYFYDMWQQAKRGENDFVPVFVAWWEHEEYQTAVPARFEVGAPGWEEEVELQKAYNLTLGQLAWRRSKIANNFSGDKELFKQEFPSNDAEAFLVSGRATFDRDKLSKVMDTCTKPAFRGEVVLVDGKPTFKEDKGGPLLIWKKPAKGHTYVIGADVAGEEEGDDHDHSSADVLDRKTGEQVAHLHGDFDPDLFGVMLEALARYYNRAGLAIEDNNHGLTTITACKKYPRLFKRMVMDEKSKRETKKLGWHTDQKSRPVLFDSLKKAIRGKEPDFVSEIILNNWESVSELMTCVRKANGRDEHQNGCKDDRVLSLGIAWQAHLLMPLWSAETIQTGDEEYEVHNRFTGR